MIQMNLFNESYAGFDQAIVNEIINMFLEDYQTALKSIESAIETENSVQLAQLAHKYKGTVSAMFDENLRQQVVHLELLAKHLDFENARKQLQLIVEGSHVLAQDLQSLIK